MSSFCSDNWGLEKLNGSTNIPLEITNCKTAICTGDNYDFKIDTFTGQLRQLHCTNIIFVQPQNKEKKPELSHHIINGRVYWPI